MNNLQLLAEKVQGNFTGEQKVFITATTAVLIVNILTSVIKLIQACKETPESTVVVAQLPTYKEQVMLKKVIRKELGFVRNWREGQAYFDAIMKTGKSVTKDDLTGVFKECQTAEFRKV
jgi:hypothetical protein